MLGMKSRDVFSFIDKLFAKGLLPQGRNLWGIAYNIDDCTGAVKLAEKNGMELWVFKRWMVEYARRKAAPPSLFLPVAMRWGIEDRPQRAVVKVPIGSMKDFDNLLEAAAAELMLELNVDADEELYVRDMRAPDAPDVWARVVIDGEEQEVTFNPVKLGRGDVKLSRECYDLRKVQVLEWHAVEDTASKKKSTAGEHAAVAASPEPQGVESLPKWLQRIFMLLGALVWIIVPIKGCQWLTEDKPTLPRAGDCVHVKKGKEATGWEDIGRLRTYDRQREDGDKEAARQTLRAAREQQKAHRVPSATDGRVLKVAKRPHNTPNGEVYCVQVEFAEHGKLWLRNTDLQHK